MLRSTPRKPIFPILPMEAPAETGEHLVKAKHRAVWRWPQPGDDPAGAAACFTP